MSFPALRSSPVPYSQDLLDSLHNIATQLRIDSIRATTAAGSGHPTSSMSAAEIMACLFFSVMNFDPQDPGNAANDKFVLSKGHAAPVLYSTWAELGFISREHLLTLRRIDSDLEGHPTPILKFVSVPTGSLGQGICVALGMALAARIDQSPMRAYALLGDGENAEGSVWEAAELANYHKVDNLCAVVDVNRLGQSQPTMLQHHLETYQQRWSAFGWNAMVVDGHDVRQLLEAFDTAKRTRGKPSVILARTLKGKGVSFIEDKDGWHGKALKPDEAEKAVAELDQQFVKSSGTKPHPGKPAAQARQFPSYKGVSAPQYQIGKEVATREATGHALEQIGKSNETIVCLDGDVENSTHTEFFQKVAPQRFIEGFIAEQNMVGMGMGLAASGKIAFCSTFACFLTRAADFIRLAGLAHLNVKCIGTHVGVSIGEDGSSQMGLEDLSLFRSMANSIVLYPSDAVSAWYAVDLAASHKGIAYVRAGRPKQPMLYDNNEEFQIGKAKVLRQGKDDAVTVVGAGVTLNEALKACDQLKKQGVSIRVIDLFSVRPVDAATLLAAARATNNTIITVEDHYEAGGVGDAVSEAVGPEGVKVYRLAVREVPHSGKPEELLAKYKIDAQAIVELVHAVVPAGVR
ncbi:MAG: transketolase [Acidobacteria bacterium]|nr:transketolase [Acidobacteriota bacterium]